MTDRAPWSALLRLQSEVQMVVVGSGELRHVGIGVIQTGGECCTDDEFPRRLVMHPNGPQRLLALRVQPQMNEQHVKAITAHICNNKFRAKFLVQYQQVLSDDQQFSTRGSCLDMIMTSSGAHWPSLPASDNNQER